jgi:hypothetical protein
MATPEGGFQPFEMATFTEQGRMWQERAKQMFSRKLKTLGKNN